VLKNDSIPPSPTP